MEQSSRPSTNKDVGVDNFQRKWAGRIESRYGWAALITGGLAGVSPIAIATLAANNWLPDQQWVFAGAGALCAVGSWAFRNADKYEAKRVERADTDGLIGALDTSLSRLHEAASTDPDGELARNFVETVIESLRSRLEPEGEDGIVRVCVYRREQEDGPEAKDGPGDARDDSLTKDLQVELDAKRVAEFTRYVFVRGARVDRPRKQFRDDEQPGMTFMPELFEHGRYAVDRPQEFTDDPDRYPGDKKPHYKSFVNLALEDSDGEAFAMLTCDSTEEYFFNARRERIMRAFSRLVGLALTRGATHAVVRRPEGLE